MNTNLLKSIMVLKGDNIKMLAEKLGMSRQTLSLKMDGYSDFKQSEIYAISRIYELTKDEVLKIFFKELDCDECA